MWTQQRRERNHLLTTRAPHCKRNASFPGNGRLVLFVDSSSLNPMQLFLLCLGFGLHLQLGFRKPQSPEIQAQCTCESHATVLPQPCSLHTFLLCTSLSAMWLLLLCLGLGLALQFTKAQIPAQFSRSLSGLHCLGFTYSLLLFGSSVPALERQQ